MLYLFYRGSPHYGYSRIDQSVTSVSESDCFKILVVVIILNKWVLLSVTYIITGVVDVNFEGTL
jgi:hypothetical protein